MPEALGGEHRYCDTRHEIVIKILMSLRLILLYIFQVPDEARVAPASSDPKSKFYELVKVGF